nr:MAG TPA: hypothetical protein [Caudoviricetes sp.]
MITLYRAAYSDAIRTTQYEGLSTDDKPLDCENGAEFKEINTGKSFMFDAEHKVWYERG